MLTKLEDKSLSLAKVLIDLTLPAPAGLSPGPYSPAEGGVMRTAMTGVKKPVTGCVIAAAMARMKEAPIQPAMAHLNPPLLASATA